VTEGELALIEQWAGRAARWKLCYKHTRDALPTINGSPLATFHRQCDGSGAKLFVAKASSGEVFGGYTAVGWSGACGYRSDGAAFLFSLTNASRYELLTPAFAVYACPTYGPTLGNGDFYTNLSVATCNPGGAFACRVGTRGSTECREDLCGAHQPALLELEVYTEY
jgi:hypothetical protein